MDNETFSSRVAEWVNTPEFFKQFKLAVEGCTDKDGKPYFDALMGALSFAVPKIANERSENLRSADVNVDIVFDDAIPDEIRKKAVELMRNVSPEERDRYSAELIEKSEKGLS